MKSFLRFLWRNKLYTAIEVLGMAVAMAFVIFIGAFIINELSYDKGLEGTENIYVAHSERLFLQSATVKEQVEGKFPEIEDICRMADTGIFGGISCYARVGDEEFRQNALVVDENFFRMFTFPLLAGTPETAFLSMNSVAVSESFAMKYFEGKDPCGQTFTLSLTGQEEPVTIGAVYKDFRNTVFPAQDIIYRFDLFGKMFPGGVGNGNGVATYFYKVVPGTDIAGLNERIAKTVKENDMLYLYDMYKEYLLSPFKDIHFGIIDESSPFEGVISKDYIRLFIAAGALLLVFALLNYISLTVAQTGFRAREMATRRLLGSQKSGIVARYLTEALILTLAAFALALVFAEIFSPAISDLIGKDVQPFSQVNAAEIIFCAVLILLLTVCSGAVPAAIVSGFEPVSVVKGEFAKTSRMTLGKIFIVIQNSVAVATLALATVMFLQIRHMVSKPMGYERDGVIQVAGAGKSTDYHIDELRQLSCVEKVGWLQFEPLGASHAGWGVKRNGEELHFDMYYGSQEAFEAIGLKVLRQNADPVSPAMWLTESAMRSLGLDYDCTALELDSGMIPVCGIIQDFTKGRAGSPSEEFLLCCWITDMKSEEDFRVLRQLAVKVSGDENEAKRQIQEFYASHGFSEEDIHVQTYNEINRRMYYSEDQNLKLISVFTGLILLLSVMAMIAMSTYYARQHAKQTAIRKVMGCGRAQVFKDTARGFLAAILLAAAIGVPCSYIVAGHWLEGYSYRIGNSLWIYLAAAVALTAVALASISWQAVRLMNTDPVTALKNE